jgi:hypothetical protein
MFYAEDVEEGLFILEKEDAPPVVMAKVQR